MGTIKKRTTMTKIAAALLTAVMAVSAYATPCFAADDRFVVDRDDRTLDGLDRTGWTWIATEKNPFKAIFTGYVIGEGMYGDCNGDNKITAVDATLISRYCLAPEAYGQEVLGLEDPDNGEYKYYFYMDVSSDGHINALDATLVLRYALLHM